MPTDLAAIRERHYPVRYGDLQQCVDDDEPWPCDTAQVLAALDGLREISADLLGVIDVLTPQARKEIGSVRERLRAALADAGSAGDE